MMLKVPEDDDVHFIHLQSSFDIKYTSALNSKYFYNTNSLPFFEVDDHRAH